MDRFYSQHPNPQEHTWELTLRELWTSGVMGWCWDSTPPPWSRLTVSPACFRALSCHGRPGQARVRSHCGGRLQAAYSACGIDCCHKNSSQIWQQFSSKYASERLQNWMWHFKVSQSSSGAGRVLLFPVLHWMGQNHSEKRGRFLFSMAFFSCWACLLVDGFFSEDSVFDVLMCSVWCR